MTARRLPALAVTDPGMVARLAHKYGPQRPAIRWNWREAAVGVCIAMFAAVVSIKLVVWYVVAFGGGL